MPFELPPDWKSAILRLMQQGGRCMVAGPTDAGKSTFCLALANACAVQRVSCAVVDADTGQSEMGPPCCVGLGVVAGPFAAISDLEPVGIHFTGSTSPMGFLAEHTSAIASVAAAAASLPGGSPRLLIIDMPGLAVGTQARRMLETTATAAGVSHIAAVQRSGEMGATLASFRGRVLPETMYLTSPPQTRVRTPQQRLTRRQLKFASYFAESTLHVIGQNSIGISNSFLFSGGPLDAERLANYSSSLGVEIVHAEQSSSHLLIVTSGRPSPGGVKYVSERSKGLELHLVTGGWYKNILVALADERGRHLALGILQAVDFVRQQLQILAPPLRSESVRQVIFGSMRISNDGREIGRVPPSLMGRAQVRAAAARGAI